MVQTEREVPCLWSDSSILGDCTTYQYRSLGGIDMARYNQRGQSTASLDNNLSIDRAFQYRGILRIC